MLCFYFKDKNNNLFVFMQRFLDKKYALLFITRYTMFLQGLDLPSF
jgi:hypothetical protein